MGPAPDGLPASQVAGIALPADVVVLDVDATIVIAHSEKKQAAATSKRTFGYHRHRGVVRQHPGDVGGHVAPGQAGSNTTTDHIEVLIAAIARVPPARRKKLLVHADAAGASHGLLEWLTTMNTAPVHGRRGRSVEYSVGFAMTDPVRAAISLTDCLTTPVHRGVQPRTPVDSRK